MAYDLIGKDFTPPDIEAKVTGRARYSEDFRPEGMLFLKLLTSPMPHARVTNIDASEALAMPGVHGILTADEVPAFPEPQDPILTNEPMFVGQPILAVTADTESIAAEALERIRIDYEELPFTVDPLQSLFPGGPNARTDGNVANPGIDLQDFKWTAADFAAVAEGQLPEGQPAGEWSYGDVDAGLAEAAVVLDESFVTAGLAHHCMETRSAMAYWENGRCHLHASCQSQSFPVPAVARYIGITPEELVFIAEFCGGGFGSKGGGYPIMAVPALMSRKLNNRPVMMRIARHEEYFIGSARPGFQGRIKMGFAADGRVTAADLYIVQENGPTAGFNDWRSAADAVSLVYTVPAMRFRGVPVLTNTPPRGPQRGPGQNQIAAAVEPLVDKAARELGLDQVEIRRINAPDSTALYGANQSSVTSAHLREALDMGAEQFNWEEKKARSGQGNGSKVIGVGVGTAYHSAGGSGFDGLVVLTPEGKLHIHTGVGNLGTYSHTGTSRVAAEALKCGWENCVVIRGDSRNHLPWNLGQFGSNTSFTMTRSNWAGAMDAVAKLKEIAAMDLGGEPDDYDIGDHKVFLKDDPEQAMTYQAAALRAIELGGKFDGHEVAEDLNPMTKASAAGIAGTGLVGVAKDNMEHTGTVPALAAGFVEIELDLETGKYEILDYLGVADCGTVIHPTGLDTQIKGGAVMGFGLAASERHIYDPQTGLPGNIGLQQSGPPSYLDVPVMTASAAVDIADPQNPVGAKGIGEPVQGCAAAALLCAISDALGGHYFNRMPVATDMIVNAASGRDQSHRPLQVNTA
ncbi:xanthine dehydrogenase family protein molybdopterin-binding subunit [Candidatus Rariloculus sp.]|uniref:xanthine dehydrogenase family protein molybdopterin-binding subunit n=1 Tax=Candidatus Rariloculus sp. TaxID=3101265 RepID=UPI003D0AD722